ncbi:hypothetical protein Hanom_Chr10g00952611 [Helianthus anomalus]
MIYKIYLYTKLLIQLLFVFLFSFLTTRNNVPTIVTSGAAVAKVDYSTVVSPLALPDTRKPDLHPLEGTTVEIGKT